jgi:hypothetical protein
MELKEIVWKRNDNGGETAYIGTVRIGQYFYNGIDSKNGTYKVSSTIPQLMLIQAKVYTVEEAKDLILIEFNDFIKKISK